MNSIPWMPPRTVDGRWHSLFHTANGWDRGWRVAMVASGSNPLDFVADVLGNAPATSALLTELFLRFLPDFAGVFADHGVAVFAAEGFGEGFHIGERAIAAEARQGMGIRLRLGARRFRALV